MYLTQNIMFFLTPSTFCCVALLCNKDLDHDFSCEEVSAVRTQMYNRDLNNYKLSRFQNVSV